MGRKYTFADVSDPRLPHITSGRFVHGHDFTHRCVGRGSLGYGYSAREAYERWKKNWKRRYHFYKDREENAVMYLEMQRKLRDRKEEKPTCEHCGAKGLNWQQVKGSNWRLHDGQKPHECKPTAEGFEDEPV